jgi:hypothetical protein
VSRSAKLRRLGVIAGVTAVFLAITVAITLVLVPGANERSAVVSLLRAQEHGDLHAMLATLPGCAARPLCLADARFDATTLPRPGSVEVLSFDPSSKLALGGHGGVARIAWHIGAGDPVVQCVRVERGSGLLGARKITLLSLSRPIGNEDPCPPSLD